MKAQNGLLIADDGKTAWAELPPRLHVPIMPDVEQCWDTLAIDTHTGNTWVVHMPEWRKLYMEAKRNG